MDFGGYMSNSKNKTKIAAPTRITGNVKFQVADDIPTHYVTEVAVQLVQTEIVLSFFEVRVPITKVPANSDLDAKCISRIAISVSKLPNLIQSLQLQMHHISTLTELAEEKG